MNRKHDHRQSITRDAVRILFFSTFLAAALFISDTGHAQAGRPPQQASDPSGYRLIGTMEGKDLAGAVISDSTGIQTFYRLKERLPDGSQVVKVRSDRVSLKRSDGTSYDLHFRGSNPDGQQSRPPATAVPPADVQETLPAYEQPSSATLNRDDSSTGQRPLKKPKLRRRSREPKD